jgi:hypothetical protein
MYKLSKAELIKQNQCFHIITDDLYVHRMLENTAVTDSYGQSRLGTTDLETEEDVKVIELLWKTAGDVFCL